MSDFLYFNVILEEFFKCALIFIIIFLDLNVHCILKRTYLKILFCIFWFSVLLAIFYFLRIKCYFEKILKEHFDFMLVLSLTLFYIILVYVF